MSEGYPGVGPPASRLATPPQSITLGEQGKFTLLTCAEHLDELHATLRKPKVANLIKPYKAGRLVNQIKKLAEDIAELPLHHCQ